MCRQRGPAPQSPHRKAPPSGFPPSPCGGWCRRAAALRAAAGSFRTAGVTWAPTRAASGLAAAAEPQGWVNPCSRSTYGAAPRITEAGPLHVQRKENKETGPGRSPVEGNGWSTYRPCRLSACQTVQPPARTAHLRRCHTPMLWPPGAALQMRRRPEGGYQRPPPQGGHW